MTLRKSIFIIIPVHNRQQTTLKCLETLMQNGDLKRYQAVVVDDGSTDGTEASIHQQYPEVIVLRGNGNLWWTGAIALGMDYASKQGAEYFIWLNDDCTPQPNTLSCLVEFCQKQPQSLTGSACYLAESNALHESGALGRQRLAAKPGEVVTVDEMSGHCVCLPASVVKQIGLPDTRRFPHYHGDSMYVLKATRSGFSAFILGDSRIDHADLIKSQVQHFIIPSKLERLHDKTLISTFKAAFLNQKSLYFLPTQFYYYREKYGVTKGIPIFLTKVLLWLIQWLQSYLRLMRLSA